MRKNENRAVAKGCMLLTIITTLLFGSCVFFITFSEGDPKTPEQIHKEKMESFFSVWSGSHRELENKIKESLNDPDSYQHVETRYQENDPYIIVMMQYRAKNGFGGYVPKSVKARISIKNGKLIEIISHN